METTAPPTPPGITGVAALQAALGSIPTAPGIYKMIGANGKILYIGKAKNLRNRVTSYTGIGTLNTRILRMVMQVAAVEIITTRNEAEALLLEASLIKRHMPRYNVLLKDDKSFPYLRLDTGHPFPRIEKHRGAQTKAGEYFGPFANVAALNTTMALLQKIFLLRPCADSIFKNRSRPCLQYQIKRCTAPCVGYVSAAQYAQQLAGARRFLNGEGREVQDMLSIEMQAASEAMDYEKAALLRDRIRALTQVQQEQGLRVAGLKDADIIAFARRGDKSVAQVHFYRNGSHFGNQSYYPRHAADADDAEVLTGFLGQFYQAHLPPPEILLAVSPGDAPAADDCPLLLLEEALSLRVGANVAVRVPQRGDKRALVDAAQANAEAALARLEMERANVAAHLQALAMLLALPHPPRRIEVYDNSHISGTNAIGAFIVATPEGFDKKSYRTFTIKAADTAPGDDYAMMREVFTRRFRGGAAPPASAAELPDLVLIDGGAGQLHAVEATLAEIGVTGLTLVAVAKGVDRNAGREWFHRPGHAPFQLPVNDPTLHYLQRLRDEAHRYAIGRHRNRRSRSFTASSLDDIPGIGGTRKRALLQHFGSRADVETATLPELERVTGISRTTARRIYDYFHG
ncbi:MAG: excinuclease ABC subunit UvrC [Alphaproteobacteria bacterium]|nr:excinuclease ABC subunit UvrC [Alphaproteobacteria bacterium]